jgi:hypothetical protein
MLWFRPRGASSNMLGLSRVRRHTVPVSSGGGTAEPPSGDRPPAGQPPTGHWITRWQTLLVAVVTAVSAIVVAGIGLLGKDDSSSPQSSPVSTTAAATTTVQPQPEATIKRIDYSSGSDGSLVITVSGTSDGLSISVLQHVRAFAQPIGQTANISVYLSGPVSLDAAGSWRAQIQIRPPEIRPVSVFLGTIDAVPSVGPGKSVSIERVAGLPATPAGPAGGGGGPTMVAPKVKSISEPTRVSLPPR